MEREASLSRDQSARAEVRMEEMSDTIASLQSLLLVAQEQASAAVATEAAPILSEREYSPTDVTVVDGEQQRSPTSSLGDSSEPPTSKVSKCCELYANRVKEAEGSCERSASLSESQHAVDAERAGRLRAGRRHILQQELREKDSSMHNSNRVAIVTQNPCHLGWMEPEQAAILLLLEERFL